MIRKPTKFQNLNLLNDILSIFKCIFECKIVFIVLHIKSMATILNYISRITVI